MTFKQTFKYAQRAWLGTMAFFAFVNLFTHHFDWFDILGMAIGSYIWMVILVVFICSVIGFFQWLPDLKYKVMNKVTLPKWIMRITNLF